MLVNHYLYPAKMHLIKTLDLITNSQEMEGQKKAILNNARLDPIYKIYMWSTLQNQNHKIKKDGGGTYKLRDSTAMSVNHNV